MEQILYTDENSLKDRWLGTKGKMNNRVFCAAIVLKMFITVWLYIAACMDLEGIMPSEKNSLEVGQPRGSIYITFSKWQN